jgi:hypothetical protein
MDEYFQSADLQQVHHPPHPQDLAPSDFFLFGFIKGALKGTHFPNGRVLICEVSRILSELQPEILLSTIDFWTDRLEQCATIGGATPKTEHRAEPDSL